MPEYLAPGVYVEEVSFRAKSIEGVDTSTAGFVGPANSGPDNRASHALTSLAEVEREYGGAALVGFTDGSRHTNWLWHSARAFFENGGQRLVVARVRAPQDAPPDAADYRSALARLEVVKDATGKDVPVSIVAAPGSTAGYSQGQHDDVRARCEALLDHAARLRRFAIVDSGDQMSIADVLAMRALFSSAYGAMYYPWVTVTDPTTGPPLHLPPSGFVAGIFARVDIDRGVHKAPANEVVRLAIGLERNVTKTEQDALNPQGVNCLRSLPARGIRVWGARTLASDPEWKYVNVRRLFHYLEHSIDEGTQWVVFEPNSEPLWAKVRQQIADFLHSVWTSGALLGSTTDEAFFVKCDRTTMTQDDIESGRLICLVGIAALKPAEFVIFRISQMAGAGS